MPTGTHSGASSIEVDDTRWPIVITRWPDGPIATEALEDYIRRSFELLQRGRQWNLHIATRAPSLDARQRARMAEHVKQHRALLAENIAGAAVVVSSALARGLVTAVNWIAPPPFPQRVFATLDEAERWIAEGRSTRD